VFRPLSKKFYEIKNPDIILQDTLNPFTTLTEGQCFPITDGSITTMIEVVELKPSSGVCIEGKLLFYLKVF
jgi:hypothetical protein